MTTSDAKSFLVFPGGRVVVFLPGTLLSVIAFIPRESLTQDETIIMQLIKMNTVSITEASDDLSKLNVKMYMSKPYAEGTIVFRIAPDALSGLKQVSP